jgi:hypothetical protein
MPLPEPKPGLVVRYDYLWSREAAIGREQGKHRPACIVAASDSSTIPRFVVLLPVTHSPPGAETVAIEIPASVGRAIGLDAARSWIILSEYNVDEWPNAGLSYIPGEPGIFSYGYIPPRLFANVKAKFLDLARKRKDSGVRR